MSNVVSALISKFRHVQSLTLLFILFVSQLSLNAYSWIPTGEDNFYVSEDCRPEKLASEVTQHFFRSHAPDSRSTWAEFEHLLQGYFNRCSDELEDGNITRLLDYAEMSLIKYDYVSHPNFQKVSFFLPSEGMRSFAFLGLKPGNDKRPLVIFQCGLTCNQQDPAMRFVTMLLHDMGPFHVLLMPSNSGQEFITENKVFAMGGLQEGRQLVKIAQIIESGNWEFSERISRIHLFGMSLGGHTAQYAATYADYLKREPWQPPLFSTVAMGCPVVDLKKSIQNITSESVIARLMRKTILANVVGLMSMIPFFDDWLGDKPSSYNPSQSELRAMMVSGVTDYYKDKFNLPGWQMPPFQNISPNSEDDIWNALNFSKEPLDLLKSPVFSWAPQDDEVVLYRDNSKVSYDRDSGSELRRIYNLKTSAGGHCSYPAAYGWKVSSAVFNSLFLSRSPELLERQRTRRVKIPRSILKSKHKASQRRWRVRARWRTFKDKDYAVFESTFQLVPCRNGRRSARRCREYSDLKVPFRMLGLSHRKIANTDVENEALTRWMNARISFETSQFEPLSKVSNPTYFKVVEYPTNN